MKNFMMFWEDLAAYYASDLEMAKWFMKNHWFGYILLIVASFAGMYIIAMAINFRKQIVTWIKDKLDRTKKLFVR